VLLDTDRLRIVDLTRALRHMGAHTASQPTPMLWPTVTHESTAPAFDFAYSIASMGIQLSDHAGTHVDAWSHLSSDPRASSVDRMPLDRFVGRATVVDAASYAAGQSIPVQVLDHPLPDGCEVVLFRTAACPDPPPSPSVYLTEFPGLTSELVHLLADRGVRAVGTDARSIDLAADEGGAHGLPAHRACLAREVVVFENLLLPEDLVGREFLFVGVPLHLVGATGSPVRAVAILDDADPAT
jgi:kynurenine formamidase